jgi:formylglycine-generating enzyme required for sulfatase activity/MinD-like ATPase involved in chromosome partitioning or flagellar assembly
MIVTFYSFKGGVGRSMALANVAAILANNGLDVIACDWDLEAPGLERYLVGDPLRAKAYGDKVGILDLLLEYKKSISTSDIHLDKMNDMEEEEFSNFGNFRLSKPSFFATDVGPRRQRYGRLRLLTAGRRGPDVYEAYVNTVQTFDWRDFYLKWAGNSYIEFFRHDLQANSDIVLVDSRTGITEHGGVCTHHLADFVVILTSANDMNLEGTRWMARALSNPDLARARGNRELGVLPVAARIEQAAEKTELVQFRSRLLKEFAEFIPLSLGHPEDVLLDTEIPYRPYYSFSERVAAQEPEEQRERRLYEAYRKLAVHLVTWGRAHRFLYVDTPPPAELTSTSAPILLQRRSESGQAREGDAVTLLERLDTESLYVPAPAGAGKSTFCRWAVLQTIAAVPTTNAVPAPPGFEEPVPTNLRGRLPLLVPLRDFHGGINSGRGRRTGHRRELEETLAAWVDQSLSDRLAGDNLLAHLRAGSAFLLLDGLDEVPVSDTRDGAEVYPRDLLLTGLADALPVWLEAGNRVLLTSRPYGLDEDGVRRLGLQPAPLEPLPRPLQDLFVARWFHALGKAEQTDGLIATLREREDLAPVAENPMMLTALCVLWDSGGRLPEDRYELYRRIVDNVLFHRFRDEVRQREPARARLEVIAYGMHVGDRETPRESPAAEISYREIDHILRAFAADYSYNERGTVGPVARREELLTRSGLLLPRPGDRAAFYHLSVQEFLAAEWILRTEDDLSPVFRARSAVAGWRPTLMFLFAGRIGAKTPRWGTDLLARLIAEQDRAAVRANPAAAVFIAEALDLCLGKNYAVPGDLKKKFCGVALNAIEDEVELQARHALGLTLGRVGDPRITDLRDRQGNVDLRAYVKVPTGTYPYGDEGRTVEIRQPFWITRYPVTNQQFAAFIAAGGYSDRRWWSDQGRAWLEEKEAAEPGYWNDRRWNAPNQPVVGVSFWEAEAFCAWAGGRLPTEEEWEAAARGSKGLVYPWGDVWQDGICNTSEAGLGVTSPVGLFPRARQADRDIDDLAGNVLEWCASLYDPEIDARVVRGGSCNFRPDYARSARGVRFPPTTRFNSSGFRVVCVAHP